MARAAASRALSATLCTSVCCASASTPLRSARRRRSPLRTTRPRPPALRTDRAKPRLVPPLQPPDLPQPVAAGPSGPRSLPGAPATGALPLFRRRPQAIDMATCLQQLAATWALDLRTECVDIKRSAKQDLSLPKVRDSYLHRIRAKEFDAILLSPPCASFSRATWANFRGPRTSLRTSALRSLPWSLRELLPSWLWSSPRTLVRYPLAHTRGSGPPLCGSGRS